ncbi:hypothetical protein LguiA_030776 [Lonicera macranthoides]
MEKMMNSNKDDVDDLESWAESRINVTLVGGSQPKSLDIPGVIVTMTRTLSKKEWIELLLYLFPRAMVSHLPKTHSDHWLKLIELEASCPSICLKADQSVVDLNPLNTLRISFIFLPPLSYITQHSSRSSFSLNTTLIANSIHLHFNFQKMSSSVSHLIYTNPLLLILFVALLLNVTLATTNYQGNETDSLALFAFKSNLHNPQGVLNSWNSSVHICQWQGITCGLRHRRVTVLNLSSSGLVGSLSPNIGNLSFLRSIALKNNSLQGQIPPEIGRLFRLQNLILYNNSLEGEIPANLSHCTNLMVITVANNKLVGEIPRELTTLSNLIFLSLSKNYLWGEIWSSFGNLTYLDTLSLAYNALEGSIPDTFGQLMKLSFLGIAVNEISGMVPSSIYSLSSLTVLSLGLNQLHGSIPHNVGLSLPYLEKFDLESNQFTGAIPTSLSNVSDLAPLQLSENNFTGKIPTSFGSLQNLQVLLMHSNFLGNEEDDDMDFLNSLTNCSQLEELEASNNQVGGVFPNSLGNLSTSMRHFGVGMNQISGVIPSGVGSLFNLEILDMTQN